MGGNWLAGEWDPQRQLVLPAPGGRLTRVLRCAVPGCQNDGYTTTHLCTRHHNQFNASGWEEIEAWLASGEPAAFERRRSADRACVVRSADGAACPRPAHGRWQLCEGHESTWWKYRRRGGELESFLSKAVPLDDLGDCAAACCWRKANYPHTRLCVLHAQLWRADGRPVGHAFERWAARARQPEDAHVLSLRGLPELVRLELVYAIGCRAADQVAVTVGSMRPWVDQLRAEQLGSLTEFDLSKFDHVGDRPEVRFARFCADRVGLVYADPEGERGKDIWDLRLFGRPGHLHLDFSPIRQRWLREAAKGWAAVSLGAVRDGVLAHRLGSVALLSAVLASGPGGGHDPSALCRPDVERFLARVRSANFPSRDKPFGTRARATAVEECAQVLREARELGLLPTLGPTFAFRRGDRLPRVSEEPPGRALPAGVIAQLDANLDILAAVPGAAGRARLPTLGALGEHAGEMAVLAYKLLKGTGRRVGEVASLHLECLDVDEHGKDVLVYDNHKAARMGRRLPLADPALVADIRAQQAWVRSRFPAAPPAQLWLLPRPHKNTDGTRHFEAGLINAWFRSWLERIPRIDAGPLDEGGKPVPFDRTAVHPHAFRHTYAQALADQGVPAPVLRDLMDHRSLSTTLGYYKVGESRKRKAMEVLARHTVDNRGSAKPVAAEPYSVAYLRWVAVPMGKCSEPPNVVAGGQACPVRYQCAGCPHFETDPSYLPELRAYADELRKEREAMLVAGAAAWAVEHVSCQLDVVTGHVRAHEALLERLAGDERALIEEASTTLRKARESVPVLFGSRSTRND